MPARSTAAEYEATLAQYAAAKTEYSRMRKAVPPPPRRPLATPLATRLYLVSRRGPACFIIADAKQTFRVTIGTRHTCSCHKAMPCVHTAWTLSRCLHVDYDMAQQPGLPEAQLQRVLDTQASQPIAGRRGPVSAASPNAAAAAASAAQQGLGRDSVDWLLHLSGEDAWLLAQPKMTNPDAPAGDEARRARKRPLEPGETCAVCMEEMCNDCGDGDAGGSSSSNHSGASGLAWCCHSKHSCGRAIHLECLRVWARHQDDTKGVTCPMCRAPFGPLGAPTKAEQEQASRVARQSTLRDEFEQLRLREAASEVVRRRQAAALEEASGDEPRAPLVVPTAASMSRPLQLPATALRSAGTVVRPEARANVPVTMMPRAGGLVAAPPRRGGGTSGSASATLRGLVGGEAPPPAAAPRPTATIDLFIYQR